MTAKRKLLLSYLALLAWIVLGAVLALKYSTILCVLFIIWGGWGIRRLLSPFPKLRFNFSRYGLFGRFYAYILCIGLACLVILSFYYGFFNYNAAYLVDYGVCSMLIACIPLVIIQIYEEIKMALGKDKESNSNGKEVQCHC
jgi:hypothetical protein